MDRRLIFTMYVILAAMFTVIRAYIIPPLPSFIVWTCGVLPAWAEPVPQSKSTPFRNTTPHANSTHLADLLVCA